MDTRTLLDTLRHHYIPTTAKPEARDGGVFAHEVAINGDWGTRADALYMGFTSASGRILIGHEIKVSRADWRNELTKVGKADAWADACHAWYIVAPSVDVVPPAELPDGWGLMLPPKNPRGRRMTIAVKARVKEDHNPPWWAVRSFAARLETLAHQERATRVQELVDAARADMENRRANTERPGLTYAQECDLRTIANLREALGEYSLEGWVTDLQNGMVAPRDLIAAVRLAAAADAGRLLEDYVRAAARVRLHLEAIEECAPEASALQRLIQERLR